MKRLQRNTQIGLMSVHGVAMVLLGAGLFYIRGTMTDTFYYVFGCAFSLLLVAASLLFVAVVDWICVAGEQQAPGVRGFLFLSTATAAIGIFLVFYPGSTIQLLCYVIGVYALLLSIGKFNFAMHWRSTKWRRMWMCCLAMIALLFSAALVMVARRDERDALAVLSAYALFIGLQMLLSLYLLDPRHMSDQCPE